MKLVRTLTITAALALIAGAPAIAGEGKGEHNAEGPRGGRGPALEHLLPPRVVDDLNLTADQKTKLADLESSFKKDAEKWRAAHPANPEAVRKARESGDKEALNKLRDQRKELMDIRKGYVDKLRESLTAEQKDKLGKALERAREHRGHSEPGPKGPPPPED
jgi:Spy/CpxP family protein refolding chaperone